ncbi:MAG TPA: PadR family transcriptional regulator [Vicinamibacterales bacterium]|nr:PadR family transcriptional regulator [Vicinamibacterales bacterium]
MPGSVLSPISLSVLLALADEPRHGYAIIKQVEVETGGRVSLEAGTLYAAIKRLQDEGLIEPDDSRPGRGGDSRRRYYRLTSPGRRVVALECDRLAAVMDLARRKLVWSPARRGGR